MAYTAFSVVFGEQPSTAKWNILGTNDSHMYGFLGDNLAWQSWSPTWANVTIGNGTVTAKYTMVGNLVLCRLSWLLGSTSAWSANQPTFTLPVTAESTIQGARTPLNYIMLEDATAGSWLGGVYLINTTTAEPYAIFTNSTYAIPTRITTTIPFTWATNDYIALTFAYEAA